MLIGISTGHGNLAVEIRIVYRQQILFCSMLMSGEAVEWGFDMDRNEKAYEKIIDYIEQNIIKGKYKKGDKLPPERDMALMLGSSRNSVREGLGILERMGAITSIQGAGNFVSGNFERTLIEVMSLMFVLENVSYRELSEFRYSLEYQAMALAIKNADSEQIERMEYNASKLAAAPEESERVYFDKRIHYTIAEASQNRYIIDNLIALNTVMDTFIKDMRARILTDGDNADGLLDSHIKMVEAIKEKNLKKGIMALDNHFMYIYNYVDR